MTTHSVNGSPPPSSKTRLLARLTLDEAHVVTRRAHQP